MEKYTQLEFDVIMDCSKNWFACPRENGIKNEIAYQHRKLNIESRKCIHKSLQICERLVYLYKEAQQYVR